MATCTVALIALMQFVKFVGKKISLRTSAWKALQSEAMVTGYAVPGKAMRGRCAWKALRHRICSLTISTGVLPSRQYHCSCLLPRTASPVIVATLRTAFQAVNTLITSIQQGFLRISAPRHYLREFPQRQCRPCATPKSAFRPRANRARSTCPRAVP